MKQHTKFLIAVITLLSFGQQHIMDKLINIEKISIEWNMATEKSLQDQIAKKNNPQKQLLENRLDALKAYLGIENFDRANKNSIRYKFLQTLGYENFKKSEFYIVEADESGEQIVIQNYVIYPTGLNSVKIDRYKYMGENWKRKESYDLNINIKSNLKEYQVKFGTSESQDDIIITHFLKSNVINSEFYLFSTFTQKEIQNVLNINN